MSYHSFVDDEGQPYGSFECFHVPYLATNAEFPETGWYWWPCQPGCLPDGPLSGPFVSEDEALADALEG